MSFGCLLCNGSGWAAVQDRKTHFLYGFRCHCSLGDRYSSKIPRWSYELKRHYYIAENTPEPEQKLKAADDNTKTKEIASEDDFPPW